MDRAQTGTQASTLSEQDVAKQLGLEPQQVITFCRQNALPKNGDHYVIPFGQIEAIKTWATDQGYLSGTSPGH